MIYLDEEVLDMVAWDNDAHALAENEILDNNGLDTPVLPPVLSKLGFVLHYFAAHTELCHYCGKGFSKMEYSKPLTFRPLHEEIMHEAVEHLKIYHKGMYYEWQRELV